MWNRKKKSGLLIMIAALPVFVFCGCQPTPDTPAVISKNDGAFEAALEVTADGQASGTEDNFAEQADPVSLQETGTYTDSFTNTAGNVSFHVELDIPALTANMPVLRVRAKTITSEKAKQVAEVLFGDADIYGYSKETAEVEESLCDWTFHPIDQDWYMGIDPEYTGDFNTQYLFAASERDGLPYIYIVSNREASDFRWHTISCKTDSDLMKEKGMQEYSTEEPTEEEIKEAQDQAQTLIDAMDIGQWVIESCDIEELPASNPFDPDGDSSGNSTVYTIVVTACPVYNGVKVTHQQQIENLRSEDVYASNYPYEEITFYYSGGHLVSFYYESPSEVVETVNENVSILSFEEAMEKCRSYLQMSLLTACTSSSQSFYGFEMFYQFVGKKVDIYQAELGLARIRVKDDPTDFYLIPAYTFRAYYALYDSNGNILLDSRDVWPKVSDVLLVVNAVDGSIINTDLGY